MPVSRISVKCLCAVIIRMVIVSKKEILNMSTGTHLSFRRSLLPCPKLQTQQIREERQHLPYFQGGVVEMKNY